MNKFLKYFCYPIHLWVKFCEMLSWTKIDSFIFSCGWCGMMCLVILNTNILCGILCLVYSMAAIPVYFVKVYGKGYYENEIKEKD